MLLCDFICFVTFIGERGQRLGTSSLLACMSVSLQPVNCRPSRGPLSDAREAGGRGGVHRSGAGSRVLPLHGQGAGGGAPDGSPGRPPGVRLPLRERRLRPAAGQSCRRMLTAGTEL